MRCPNCGNENPPDYVFCDECGARLQAGEDTGIAAQGATTGTGAANQTQAAGAVGAIPVAAGGQAQQGYGADTGYGSSQGGQAQTPATPYDGGSYAGQVATTGEIGGDSGPMDAGVIGGGQVAGDAQGGGGAGAGTTGGDLGDVTGYNSGQQATQATYGEDKGFGAGPSATSAQGVSATTDYSAGQGTGAAAAVTEDTMQTDGGGQSQAWQPGADDSDIYAPSAQAGEDQGASMPGVLEIDEDGAQTDQGAAGYAPVASGETYSDTAASAGGQASNGGQGAWASQALNLLDRAQTAMGRGDWAAFGSGMSELRSYLTGLGATTSTGAWTAGSYDAAPSASTGGTSQPATSTAAQPGGYSGSDTSVGQSSTYGGYNEPAYSGSTTAGTTDDAPTLEPQAEAGTLGTQEDTGYEAGYGDAGDGGASVAQAAQDAGAGTSSDAGGAQPADTGVGMMGQGASQAAVGGAAVGGASGATVGGAAVSPNGTVENMMARLVIISTGAELPLPDQEEIMVGREDPSSGIFPDVDLTPYGGEEGGVSRRHARLLHISGDYFVEDLQSTNFTKLDGQRLPAHVRERLEDGARIDFGRVATIFRRS
ncbi:MAG TPA: FHA domain-containing protein [Chloroflexia bacterium]|jgi:hypothetical protein